MSPEELIEKLRRISPDQQGQLDALAKLVVRRSRALPRAAAAHLTDNDQNLADNAMSLLIDIEDLATVPLLEAPEPAHPYDRVARMTIIVDSQLEIRNTTVERLKKMLDDKRPMNYQKMPRVEESPPPSRVCDEAYVLLRRLLNTTEDQETQTANTRLFLRLPEARKDIEIRKARTARTWTNLAGGAEE
jgi:hypothetical protein